MPSLKHDEVGSDTYQIRIFKLHVALTLTQHEVWRGWRRARIQVSREVLPAQLFHWERSGFLMLGRKFQTHGYFDEVPYFDEKWKNENFSKFCFLMNTCNGMQLQIFQPFCLFFFYQMWNTCRQVLKM